MSKPEPASKYWTPGSPEKTGDKLSLVFNGCSQGAETANCNSTVRISSLNTAVHRYDNDSGMCNLSKTTNSIGSASEDIEGSEDEGHGGSFDSVLPKVNIYSGCHLEHDEVHEIMSDHSNLEINSLQSDISKGIKMTTFQYSYDVAGDNLDEDFLIGHLTTNDHDDFHTDSGSNDDDNNKCNWDKSGHIGSTNNLHRSSLTKVSVDQSIKLSVLNDNNTRHPFSDSASSEKVNTEKNCFKKESQHGHESDSLFGLGRVPPFGNGLGHINKITRPVDQLISPASDQVEGMKQGAMQLTNEILKKNLKKKIVESKDVGAATDENGNPVVPVVELTKSEWHQMRLSPSTGGPTASNNNFSSSTISSDQYKNQNHRSNTENPIPKVSKHKRLLEKDQKETKKAEEIENYKGNLSLDELINFIGGQNVSDKKSKQLSNTSDRTPKAEKSNKKNKDKKQKSPSSCNCIELVESLVDSSAQSVRLDLLSDNMGNSSVKTVIPVENGDIKDEINNLLNLQPNCTSVEKFTAKETFLPAARGFHSNEFYNEIKEKESSTKHEMDVGIINDENNKKQLERESKNDGSHSVENVSVVINMPKNLILKQKNAKNKKAKSSTNATEKAANESLLFDSYHETFHEDCKNDNLISDNNFIFTDIEVPHVPREDEFQVVGKKKKKTAKEICQHNFLNSVMNHKLSKHHNDKYQGSTYNSKRMSNVAQCSAVESDLHIHDLSPSAFPALTDGKSTKSFQEGRRNSTGDVSVPSGMKVQDDSDIESVKSLPATQGSHTVGSAFSSRLSYAKIAAASNRQPQSDKRLSQDRGDSDHNLKKAVWKGSPTERRHSIGSSPEVVHKILISSNTTSVANSLKTGSEENVVAAADITVMLEKTSEGVNTFNVCIEAGKCEAFVGKDVFNINESSSNANVSTITSQSLSPVSFNKNHDANVYYVDNLKSFFSAKQTKNVDNETETNFCSSLGKNLITNSNVHKHESSRIKSGNTGSYSKKQKSVIFLDKRVEETPENLGISFGFEIEPVVTDLCHNKLIDAVNLAKSDNEQVHKKTYVKTLIEPSVENISCLADKKDLSNNDMNPPNTSSSNASNRSDKSHVQNHESSSVNLMFDSLTKATTHLVKMNGIITPQGQNISPKQDSINDVMKVNQSSKVREAELTMLDAVHQQDVPESNEVYVYYGESVTNLKNKLEVPIQTNKSARYCGILGYIKEADVKSNFNVIEAASVLKKEWDKTINLQKNGPSIRPITENYKGLLLEQESLRPPLDFHYFQPLVEIT